MPGSMLVLFILGLIDVVAGIILFFVAGMEIVKWIALILIIKGLWSISKCIFKF